MGNFLFGHTFVSYTPTASSTDPDYPVANLYDYEHPKRPWKSWGYPEVTIVCDYGSAKAIVGVFLNDVNFTDVYIQGNAADSWGSPSFSQQFTVSKDERTVKWKLYAALTGFNYRYLRIRIPAQVPQDGSAYRIGTLVCLNTVLGMTNNPTPPYDYSADEAVRVVEFPSGATEKINLGDLAWKGSFSFDPYLKVNESDFWTLNSIKKDQNLVFFENETDTSKAYLCRRDAAIEVSWHLPNAVRTNRLEFREII